MWCEEGHNNLDCQNVVIVKNTMIFREIFQEGRKKDIVALKYTEKYHQKLVNVCNHLSINIFLGICNTNTSTIYKTFAARDIRPLADLKAEA